MAPAHETLRAMGCPIVRTSSPELRWTLDLNNQAAIIVGYGTDDHQERSKHHHIIKFYRGADGRSCFGMIEAQNTYPGKHARVSMKNIKLFDPNLRITEEKLRNEAEAKKFIRSLKDHFSANFGDATECLKAIKTRNNAVPDLATEKASIAIADKDLDTKDDKDLFIEEENDKEEDFLDVRDVDIDEVLGTHEPNKPNKPNTSKSMAPVVGGQPQLALPNNDLIAAAAKQATDFAKINKAYTANVNMTTAPLRLATKAKNRVMASPLLRYTPY